MRRQAKLQKEQAQAVIEAEKEELKQEHAEYIHLMKELMSRKAGQLRGQSASTPSASPSRTH